MATRIIHWQAHEFEHREKRSGWYATFILIALLLIGYEAYTRDYFAALTFFVMAVVLLYFSRITPREVEISISDKGIHIGNLHIPYTSIKRFWIVNRGKTKALHLDTTAYLNSRVIIELADQDPDEIHSVLLQFVPDDHPNQETIAQRIARRLHF